ncbi:ADP-ribosylation factor-like protein 2 isoform X1 [Heterocephalus glaber]|uniref:ADP-ribosylation factor-like protein 2 isoform X1 n=1 Tax=Heterocephalus glaber TaxID=10181 RepID=A0AAX6TGK8_HETGA|nr:ADP-ribosylation factor-like protein 2 isoform X1 [Heterocephalus glaber]
MGLLTILKKMKQKERELRLLMLGLDNAGKTTILKKFNGEDVDTISPTLGFNIKTLEHRGFKLNIWDVGGQKSLRSYWRNYFESTDGLIWVVDSADRQRLQDCARELQGLLVEESTGSRLPSEPQPPASSFPSAWLELPSSSSPTSRTCPEHCPLMPFKRPWSWTLSAATTGAFRAAALSLGRTCCWASTGCWTTSPVASSQLTESLQMSPSRGPGSSPHPHHPKGMGASQWTNTPPPVHQNLLLLLPSALPGPRRKALGLGGGTAAATEASPHPAL